MRCVPVMATARFWCAESGIHAELAMPDSADSVSQDFPQDFDPLKMMTELMTGEVRLHSIFIAPFTPSFAAARQQYLTDGTGPLTIIADELARQGAPEPPVAARAMLTAAKGMAVVVLALDHGVATVPQLFFGHLGADVRQQMVAACGEKFPAGPALEQVLIELEARLGVDHWPALVAGPAQAGDLPSYWLELSAALLEGTEGGFAGFSGGRERLTDLAWWISQGIFMTHVDTAVPADDLDLLVRCLLLAGDPEGAGQGINALVRSGGADEEGVIELLNAFVDGAIGAGQAQAAGAWLAGVRAEWDELLGGLYDLPLALFRLQAAAGVGPDILVPTARLLSKADRKAARNDLTKEPIWLVVAADPGDLLDTSAAAERIGRSTSFIAKRLEAKTIPTHRAEGGQVRIPLRALDAWKAVMDELKLLD